MKKLIIICFVIFVVIIERFSIPLEIPTIFQPVGNSEYIFIINKPIENNAHSTINNFFGLGVANWLNKFGNIQNLNEVLLRGNRYLTICFPIYNFTKIGVFIQPNYIQTQMASDIFRYCLATIFETNSNFVRFTYFSLSNYMGYTDPCALIESMLGDHFANLLPSSYHIKESYNHYGDGSTGNNLMWRYTIYNSLAFILIAAGYFLCLFAIVGYLRENGFWLIIPFLCGILCFSIAIMVTHISLNILEMISF
jgi:hypothetical protein